ncbi:probable carboxylesterase 8 [Vicia villosa]|uniref:probable carboxylesterase 8 n=1 Tax=Vicia villosa TaxID=3911 RepID=UPI00273A77FF|nr:probable carboxylesterase 8 [Vicia villosa]
MAESSSSNQHSTIDPYKFLNINLNSNSSLTRYDIVPTVAASTDPNKSRSIHALSKDITLNTSTKTSIRLFLPHTPSPSGKLPLILYFHGGGFIQYHNSSHIFHHSCSIYTSNIPAVFASVDYRLSPEHRLPAAYEDAVESLLWLKSQAENPKESDPWIKNHVNFDNCFIMGLGAGANIAYFSALRTLDLDLSPLKIQGLILNCPLFGGVQRTKSELRLFDDHILPLPVADLMWSLALPEGADRDHVYCNPTVADEVYGEKIGRLPRCLVSGYDGVPPQPDSLVRYCGDPLVDKQREFVKILKARGVHVVECIMEHGFHAKEVFEPFMNYGMDLIEAVKKFVGS